MIGFVIWYVSLAAMSSGKFAFCLAVCVCLFLHHLNRFYYSSKLRIPFTFIYKAIAIIDKACANKFYNFIYVAMLNLNLFPLPPHQLSYNSDARFVLLWWLLLLYGDVKQWVFFYKIFKYIHRLFNEHTDTLQCYLRVWWKCDWIFATSFIQWSRLLFFRSTHYCHYRKSWILSDFRCDIECKVKLDFEWILIKIVYLCAICFAWQKRFHVVFCFI